MNNKLLHTVQIKIRPGSCANYMHLILLNISITRRSQLHSVMCIFISSLTTRCFLFQFKQQAISLNFQMVMITRIRLLLISNNTIKKIAECLAQPVCEYYANMEKNTAV